MNVFFFYLLTGCQEEVSPIAEKPQSNQTIDKKKSSEPTPETSIQTPEGSAKKQLPIPTRKGYAVILPSHNNQKIPIIRVLREVYEMKLKDCKALVESAPVIIQEGMTKEQSDNLVEEFKKQNVVVQTAFVPTEK